VSLAAATRTPGQEKDFMGNTGKRIAGVAEELGGTIEKAAGKATGDEQLQAKGRARELVGRARQEAAKAAARAQGTVEQIVGGAKNRLGSAIGNERMRDGGKATELKGEARRKLNK